MAGTGMGVRRPWALLGLGLAVVRSGVRRARRQSLAGKVVLITGGSRGLGLELGRQFARVGAKLVICARDEAELERARRELEGMGAEVLAVPCDLAELTDLDDLMAAVEQRFGSVDVLVNNAGIIQVGPWELMTEADDQAAMKVHYWAPLQLIRRVVPGMRARKAGHIVNISSFAGRFGVPLLVPYSASKFALAGLTQALGPELKRDGVRMTGVYPFVMRVGSAEHAFFKGQHRLEYSLFSILASVPGFAASPRGAAKEIVEAVREGRREVVIGLPAKLLFRARSIAPEWVGLALEWAARLLPRPASPEDTRYWTGAESHTGLFKSPLFFGHRRSMARYHEGDPAQA